MNARFARLLTRLYPRPWQERYGEEFQSHLLACRGNLRTAVNVFRSAMEEHIFPTPGLTVQQRSRASWFHFCCAQAPWAVFCLAPVLLLAGAYVAACLILWSGWRIFLPASPSPFVRIDGLAILYFGLGRWLYYGAPIVISWTIGSIAVRQKLNPLGPIAGFALMAFIGGTARVHAAPAFSGGAGHISMNFAMSDGVLHALLILSLGASPYLFRLLLQKTRFRAV